MKVIVVTGPESSGKTKLVNSLHKYYNPSLKCIKVDEYARIYLSNKKEDYDFQDLLVIGKGQRQLLIEAIKSEADLILVDTWIYVLQIWAKLRFGKIPNEFLQWEKEIKIDAFLLCYPDLPWEPDPQREHPNHRMEIYSIYEKVLKKASVPVIVITGEGIDRRNNAIEKISEYKILD